ncbi:hypothetical protein B0T16DRAFT_327965 [Cercophora newfieldiana]|uniref:AAA+ ATPase domain-containing protein n=1 Tax=Cercophora newfieldiana TaxID=92897 RepID=A0AA39Y7X7_9PEZI|nr:hypothetical protein B0T16DRAFT_327965 [Cercophora newfieldiana]
MPSKRKRDILEGFDPNASDPEDENFDPTDDRAPKSSKKTRTSKTKRVSGGKSRSRSARYRGSDIEDDEDVSDSQDEHSFADDDEDDEEDEDLPITSTGRRMRKAAVVHPSYKESSEDDVPDAIESENDSEDDQPKKRPSRIVVLKTGGRNSQRPKRGKEEATTIPPPTRRNTRARTEETEEAFVELTNSGRHAQPARASRSRSPETMSRATRATRGAKGVKKPPATIEEATQESDPKTEAEAMERDELAPSDEENQPEKTASDAEEVADAEAAKVSSDATLQGQPAEIPDQPAEDADDDDDDDDAPITRRTRTTRGVAAASAEKAEAEPEPETEGNGTGRRLTRRAGLRGRKTPQEPSSDFDPGEESADAEMSASEASVKKGQNGKSADEASSSSIPARGRGTRSRSSRKTRRSGEDSGDEEMELDKDEMAEELEELRQSSRSRPRRRKRSPSIQYEERTPKKRRTAKPVNYSIQPIDIAALEVDEDEDAQTPAKGRRGGKGATSQAWERNFNSTYGPFGGGGGGGALIGGPWGTGATGGVDSDSSDDEMVQRSGVGGTVGMTPTSAAPPLGLFNPMAAPFSGADGAGGVGGATPNVGKIKNQKAFADADPLGVDMSVDFSKVGGLQGHIEQLKEMVQLPLLYPELFQKFHVTPPRGVLFHGPPGTGKTLLARALANSVGSGGRKITFYMRKGADALSKWVGEAEKQLRLLFEDAKKNQPSIILFDEIDGLAPVRSSKQEQIHASIVSTLLALMDGMDGRGQVIVIGATNRPDNIDPALRRPGRFDREFYFPLPDIEGRRAILDIHTKDWGLSDVFKNSLAGLTKGYGGADLRALCTEAALNAIQRTYPQIYSSKEKLVVDPHTISITATDFMISVKKMIPSSERSASSAATPLPPTIEPLLRDQYQGILRMLDNILPRPKKATALDEAMYEQHNDADHGFGREALHQEFERSRIFRPRLLLCGTPGMGQNYLANACLHHLEGIHIQNFDLATLLGDGRPLEQVIVSLFTEVRRHKPGVIYIPNVEIWWNSLGESAITTFTTMLKNIPPADPILLLGTSDSVPDQLEPGILEHLFGFSKKNRAVVDRPDRENRIEFFTNIVAHVRKSPLEFPDPADRKKRVLEDLPVAPPPPPRTLTKEEIKAQRKADLHHLNLLKMRLQPIMDQIHRKYRKFRQPVIPFAQIAYLFAEQDPNYVRPDVVAGENRPYEIDQDKEGTGGIRETATGKFFYNLETTTIEERLANGYYARPIDFYKDINRLYLDAKNIGDRDRTLKANELRTNVEVDVHDIGQTLSNQGIRFEEIYQRQLQRTKEAEEKAKKRKALQPIVDLIQSDLPDGDSDSQGPVGIGIPMSGAAHTTAARFMVMSPKRNGTSSSDSHPLTNGTSAPSRRDGEDVVMSDVNSDSQPQRGGSTFQFARPPIPPLGDSTRAIAGTQLSQRSAVTALPPGVSPSAVLNDASTTKTSDPSTNRGDSNWSTQRTNTQRTNGLNSDAGDETQLLDTQSQNHHSLGSLASQGTSSERDWAHSQAAGIAQGILPSPMGTSHFPGSGLSLNEDNSPSSSQRARNKASNVTSLDNILNDTPSESTPSRTSGALTSVRNSGVSSSGGSSQQPILHEGSIQAFLYKVVDRTSGCSVEQLEQINRELMDEIWRTRGDWNRMSVLSSLTSVFNDTIGDIELVQGKLEGSQADEDSQAGSQGNGAAKGKARDDQPFVYLRDEDERQERLERQKSAAGAAL